MAKLDNTTVGFIGVDTLGQIMAKRIHSAGATTYAYDRSPALRYEIARASISLCQSPAEIATKAQGGIIILMLSDNEATDSAMEGDSSLFSTLESNTLVINMGDLEAEHAKHYATLATQKGAIWINAPAIGDEKDALNGELQIRASAEDADYERALPILQCLSKSVSHVG